MKTVSGNIWDWFDKGYPIVIPTNIGWTKAGYNVMGRGLAKQAADRFPELPDRYGKWCKMHGAGTPVELFVMPGGDLILFPVKPLNEVYPHLSWQARASLDLIERSTIELALLTSERGNLRFRRVIFIPLVGCGNGWLSREDVLPILDKFLDDRFLLCEIGGKG